MNENSRLKSIEKIRFGEWYQSSLIVSADWVGGGNFEGQISRHYLKFIEDSNIVEFRSDLLGIRFGKPKSGEVILGNYNGTDKGAIRVELEGMGMIGFILGPNNEYIAFDVKYENINYRTTNGYELLQQENLTK